MISRRQLYEYHKQREAELTQFTDVGHVIAEINKRVVIVLLGCKQENTKTGYNWLTILGYNFFFILITIAIDLT